MVSNLFNYGPNLGAYSDSWLNSIESFIDFTASEPAAPTLGDRYINTVTGVSSVTAQAVTANYLYQYNGSIWDETIPIYGNRLYDRDTGVIHTYTPDGWVSAESATFWDKTGVDVTLETPTDNVVVNTVRALSASGLSLKNSAGSAGILVNDAGDVETAIVKADNATGLDLVNDAGERGLRVTDSGDIIIGEAKAGKDYTITVNGESNDGVITFDEDYKKFIYATDLDIEGSVNAYDIFINNSLKGFTLSNNAADSQHDVDIAIGQCKDALNLTDIKASLAFTKRLDAGWAVGTNNGGLGTGSIAADTEYRVFVIMDSNRNVDYGFDVSPTASNLLATSGYSSARYLGSVFTDPSSNIRQFKQTGRTFIFTDSIANFSTTNPGTSAVLELVSVPSSIKVMAHLNVGLALGAASIVYFSDPDTTDVAPSLTIAPLGNLFAEAGERNYNSLDITTSSAQIRYRASSSDASTVVSCITKGYTDFEGL